MFPGKGRIIPLLIVLIFSVTIARAQTATDEAEKKSLEMGIGLLKKYFQESDSWHPNRDETGEKVRGLVQFIEREPIDTIIVYLNKTLKDTTSQFVYRLPEEVSDSLEVPGYYQAQNLQADISGLWNKLETEYMQGDVSVPLNLIDSIEQNAPLIPSGEGEVLFRSNYYEFPDSLQIPDVIPDSLIQSPVDFQHYLKLDSIRDRYIEQKRKAYNDSIFWAYRDSVVTDFRRQKLEEAFEQQKQQLIDSVRLNNYTVLRNYNNEVMEAVNDSIAMVLDDLIKYADFVDTTRVHMTNLVGDESSILLQNNNQYFSRVWLKNEQNDSLRVLVKNLDKKTIQLLIDDGVTFSRFTPKETKEFDFSSLRNDFSGFTGVGQKYQVLTPWQIGGDGSVGVTQTYLNNWKKGGQSALSLLLVLKGFANYSGYDGKIKWENSGEIRNGWIRPGGKDAETQKNDDKLEFTSRFGVSAFKKWYYSAEFNFETQLFNGYKYPTIDNPDPISAFMAPSKTFFKLGLDYKPNNNFSLLLSPLTAKNIFVKDTVKIDQTKFGVDADKRGFWLPGLNADVTFKKDITPDIRYETKYKMFINYKKPFSKFDINWENLMVMRLNDHINMRMMVHLIYDDDVKFPVENSAGETVYEPRLQLKEFFTVGFTYKINRRVTRTRRK
jgi:hypothetical protein